MTKQIKLNLKEPVKVYWNLTSKVWSVVQNKKVVYHAKNIVLKNVTFKVSEAGRQRVILQKRKNVHAFACGRICKIDSVKPLIFKKEVVYNPYKRMYFYEKLSGKSLYEKDVIGMVSLTNDGKVYMRKGGIENKK